MSTVLQSRAYPAVMDQKLRQVCRRQLALAVIRALLLGTATLLASVLVAMMIDWGLTLFNTTARALLTFSAVGVTAVTLVASAARPIGAALRLRHAARDVDDATPQLEERWTTVANFVGSKHHPRSTVGKAMLRQVTSEAVTLGRLVEPATVVRTRQLNWAVVAFTAATLLTVTFFAVNGALGRILLSRFLSPLTNITATQLESLSGNVVIPRGESVELIVRMSGIPRDKAILELASTESDLETAELKPNDKYPDQFHYSVAALDASFQYRVQAGDGRTAWHSVTAIDRPELAEVKLTLTAPDYVNRPVYEKDYLPARVQAVQGSELRLEMRSAATLKRFELQIRRDAATANSQNAAPADAQKLVLSADKDGWYRFRAILDSDVTITPALLSPHDLTNVDQQKCIIHVLADRAPTARVISPAEEMAVSPNDVIDVKFEAHDDHGITKAELVVYEEPSAAGEKPRILNVEEVDLADQQNAPHILATAKLDLSKYTLDKDARISYAVRVTDNRVDMQEPNARNESGPKESVASQEKIASKQNEDPTAKSASESKDPAADPKDPAADPKDPAGKTKDLFAESVDRAGESVDPAGKPVDQARESDRADKSDRVKTDDPLAGKGKSEKSNDTSAEAKSPQETSGKPGIAEEIVATTKADSAAAAMKPEGTPAADRKPESTEKSASPEAVASQDNSKAGVDAPKPQANARGAEKSQDATQPAGEESKSGETPSQVATDTPAESDESKFSPPVAAGPRRDDKSPNPDPSQVTGDLTSAMRRPTMTDDQRGQFAESNRLRLKIEQKVSSAAEVSVGGETIQMKIRQRLEQIDRELKPAEEVLSGLVETVKQSGVADPQIQKLTETDRGLAKVDEIIAKLRNESKQTPYAFVGLHVVEIGMAQITPARDHVFALIRQPDVDAHRNVAEALHRVSRARELIAELLVRYERVLREEKLADRIKETAKFYEVYVENLHRFLRAQSKPNPNPLQRKLAVVEVDQDYLDRLRQVTEMRRDLMAELGRMLADDPRLLSKYMDLLKRRQASLRDQLTQLRERQEAIGTELSGWLRVDESQREDVWMLAAEVRLQDIGPLAQEASQLEERTTSQFPLSLDPKARDSSMVVSHAKQLAISIRTAAAKARRLLRDPADDSVELSSDVEQAVFWLAELDAALEQLAFDHPGEEATEFSDKRLAECRTLFERLLGWTEISAHLHTRQFDGLAKVDQQQLALRTELLRLEIDGIDQQLATEFRGEVPAPVMELANQLKQLMEAITFNQAAATFDLESMRLVEAEVQQGLALDGFKRAEELFDQIRRKVVEELDKIDPQDPNIADLEDPTLDELLERLEREPDLNALLGLPNRPQNLRVMSDFVAAFNGDIPVPMAMEEAAEKARQRAKKEEAEARRMRREKGKEDDKSDEEWQKVADAEQAQQLLQDKIDAMKKRAEDPKTEPEEAAKLRQMADQLAQMQRQLGSRQIDKQQWEEMVRSDQMRLILQAASRGEPLPDTQWNRLMSSLDEGLWQVRRRTPPEDFRQAIEQYQEQIRRLVNLEGSDEGQ